MGARRLGLLALGATVALVLGACRARLPVGPPAEDAATPVATPPPAADATAARWLHGEAPEEAPGAPATEHVPVGGPYVVALDRVEDVARWRDRSRPAGLLGLLIDDDPRCWPEHPR